MEIAQETLAKCPEPIVVSLARSGDRDAFAELVQRRQASTRALLRRCCGDGTLADDLAQKTFIQAWLRLSALNHPAAFGSWLRRIAVSVWLQHQRGGDALHGADELGDDVQAAGDATGMRLDLDHALTLLPGVVRLCIVLAYQEGMTHPEIAEATRLPLGTVKSHINRGTHRLREVLAAYREHSNPENHDG